MDGLKPYIEEQVFVLALAVEVSLAFVMGFFVSGTSEMAVEVTQMPLSKGDWLQVTFSCNGRP